MMMKDVRLVSKNGGKRHLLVLCLDVLPLACLLLCVLLLYVFICIVSSCGLNK